MIVIKPLILILISAAVIFLYVKYQEKKNVYHPLYEMDSFPSSAGLAYEDINITTNDGIEINGWFIGGYDAGYTFLFCHGNGGNISHRIEKIKMLHELDVNIFIFDYRGYGRSKGSPSEKGLYLDSRAAYDYLVETRRIRPEEIILYGESLGTAVAIELALGRKVRAIILEGAFSSGRDMAGVFYPFLPPFMFSNLYDSITRIKKVDTAKLFLHGRDDGTVPFGLSRKLFEAAGEPKEFVEMHGGHNDFFTHEPEEYMNAVASFIEGL